MNRRILFAALLLLAAPAVAETVEGTARVKDGDTLAIAGIDVRLSGLDAPEMKQGRAGRYSRAGLMRHINGEPVVCAGDELDKYGRLVGRCAVRGREINVWMVERGLAFAYWPYRALDLQRLPCPHGGAADCHYTTPELLRAEDRARAAGRGLWRWQPLPDYPAWSRHPERRPRS